MYNVKRYQNAEQTFPIRWLSDSIECVLEQWLIETCLELDAINLRLSRLNKTTPPIRTDKPQKNKRHCIRAERIFYFVIYQGREHSTRSVMRTRVNSVSRWVICYAYSNRFYLFHCDFGRRCCRNHTTIASVTSKRREQQQQQKQRISENHCIFCLEHPFELKNMASMRVSDIFSLMWSITSSRLVDCCRNIKSEVVTVTTKAGLVKGYKVQSSFAYQYINFFGIPYGKPPVGDLRFKVSGFRYFAILKTI